MHDSNEHYVLYKRVSTSSLLNLERESEVSDATAIDNQVFYISEVATGTD